ncbi:MAG: GreA/GreB family elongation factor [Polyangiaceae bacterium]|nr:GreA/GreB family elongation factor [Polyangiaceae bacterium]
MTTWASYNRRVAGLPSKTALKEELLRLLEDELSALERAQRETAKAATHEEAKPENDKDTRALEQSYLARGQAARVEDLRTGFAETQNLPTRAFSGGQPAALGALITAEEGDQTHVYFLAGAGGGLRLGGGAVQVVTTKSPLGRALLGKREGDDVEVPLAGKIRELSLLTVE